MPATKRKMDFTNVKEGGSFRPRHKPEGDYAGKIIDVADHTSHAGGEGWVFTAKIDGDERSSYPVYVSSETDKAWKIRKMFIAAGIPVPKKMVMVDPNKLIGKALGITLEDEEYEGRMRSKPVDFLPMDDIQGNADEEADDEEEELYEKPTPKKRAAKKAAPVVEEEEEDDEEEEEEAPVVKPKAKRKPAPPPVEEDDDDEEEEDEEEEVVVAPVRKKKAGPAPVKKAAKKAPVVEDDDDDEDLDLDEL